MEVSILMYSLQQTWTQRFSLKVYLKQNVILINKTKCYKIFQIKKLHNFNCVTLTHYISEGVRNTLAKKQKFLFFAKIHILKGKRR